MTNNSTTVEVKDSRIDIIVDRSLLYQFLSACFLEPNSKTIAILSDRGYRQDVEEAFHSYIGYCGMSAGTDKSRSLLEGALEALDGITLEKLAADHRWFFGGHVISHDCPNCESFYGTEGIFQLTSELADIGGFYRAFGLETSRELNERPDHIGTELEFMHFLTYKEAYAIENEGEEKRNICVNAQMKFLKDHLGRWVGCFSDLVEKKASEGIYPRLAKFLKHFISLEMRQMDVEADEASELNLQILDAKKEEDDFTCAYTQESAGKEGFPC